MNAEPICRSQDQQLHEGYSLAFRSLTGIEGATVSSMDNGAPHDPNLTMTAVVDEEEISRTVSKRWFREFLLKNAPEHI